MNKAEKERMLNLEVLVDDLTLHVNDQKLILDWLFDLLTNAKSPGQILSELHDEVQQFNPHAARLIDIAACNHGMAHVTDIWSDGAYSIQYH